MALNLHHLREQIEEKILGYSTGYNPITKAQAIGAAVDIVSLLEKSLPGDTDANEYCDEDRET